VTTCRKCREHVDRSRTRGRFERTLKFFGFPPYRCGRCGWRGYRGNWRTGLTWKGKLAILAIILTVSALGYLVLPHVGGAGGGGGEAEVPAVELQ
jgi:hypothetical protein